MIQNHTMPVESFDYLSIPWLHDRKIQRTGRTCCDWVWLSGKMYPVSVSKLDTVEMYGMIPVRQCRCQKAQYGFIHRYRTQKRAIFKIEWLFYSRLV